ncbi:MAG TPA: hypothetical protein DC058_16825 [Planctomycetaceae bacterium]|nr:hypothetical protein [Planctomycetaceae bacterium]
MANRPEFRYARSGELYFFFSNSGNFPGSLLKSDRILNWFVSGQPAENSDTQRVLIFCTDGSA